MDDDDLDLVESEDGDTDYYEGNNQFQEIHNRNPFNPLSRNIANIPASTGLEHMSPGKFPGYHVLKDPEPLLHRIHCILFKAYHFH